MCKKTPRLPAAAFFIWVYASAGTAAGALASAARAGWRSWRSVRARMNTEAAKVTMSAAGIEYSTPMFYYAVEAASSTFGLKTGDNVVVTGGQINGKSGNTNTIKVETVE